MTPAKRLLRHLGFAATLFASACASASNGGANDDGLHVKTRQGVVVGAMADGIRSFRGIPYAAPPVGEMRWRPPTAAAKWSGVRDATEFGPPCVAFDGSKMAQGRRESGLGFDIFYDVPAAPGTSEDCLNLNIWAPENAKGAAVMVWLQPIGASSMPLFDGSAFARDGVVFVTIDYRQLSMGNFAHPALTREAKADEPLGRFQTMDQMAALRWVKENIAAFGGDRNNVTVFGESAGGASTLQLLTIPSAKGLFDNAIVQSGNGWWSPFTLEEMEKVGSMMATQAGLPGKDATAEQLRALPVDKLAWLGAYSIDGRMQKENATDAVDAGRAIDVPLMIGWTDFDGSSLRYDHQVVIDRTSPSVMAAYAGEGKTGQDLAYQLYTDSHVGAPARWIAAKTEGGAPTYLYLFSYVRSASRGKVRGAAHGDDISYVFDSWAKSYPQLQLSEEDRAATRLMHSCWVSFAKIGKPACEGAPEWPRYSREKDQVMELGLQPKVLTGYRQGQLNAQEAAMRQDVIADTRASVAELAARLK
jgi:para-nitrobenzyl esterase